MFTLQKGFSATVMLNILYKSQLVKFQSPDYQLYNRGRGNLRVYKVKYTFDKRQEKQTWKWWPGKSNINSKIIKQARRDEIYQNPEDDRITSNKQHGFI